MKWDFHLLRRFSSTSHFRLISQLRNELRNYPLNRNTKNNSLNLEAKPTNPYSIRDNRRFMNSQVNNKLDENIKYAPYVDPNQKSFKDRLDTIDMR